MALSIEKLVRAFRYNGMDLVDPGAGLAPEAVKEFYANIYPELNNAAIEGPEHVGAKAVYEFRKAVGTKGVRTSLRTRLDALVAGQGPRGSFPSAETLELSEAISECVRLSLGEDREERGDALALPSSLLPILP